MDYSQCVACGRPAVRSTSWSPEDFLAGFAAEFNEAVEGVGVPLREEIRSSMPASIALRECGHCGLTWSDPMVAGSAAFYELVYAYMRKADPPRWEFDHWRERGPCAGLLIDIGAGDGGFVAWAQSLGYDATGLELNPAQVEKARQAGRSVVCLPVEEMSGWLAERGTPVVITLWHVFEHVADPAGLLRSLRAAAGPQTELVVAVPSDRFFLSQHGARPITDFPPHHLTRWTPAALQELTAATGWRVIEHCYEPIVKALPLYYGRAWRALLAGETSKQLRFSPKWDRQTTKVDRLLGRFAALALGPLAAGSSGMSQLVRLKVVGE